MMSGFIECFWVALKLGVSAFGGPVAHLGYFREVYVERNKWLGEDRYGELVALTQFLPGPGSSQLGAAIGYHRAGWLGGFGAWLGFTLPSALVMIALAIGLADIQGILGTGWLHGLKLAAVAVVIVATLGMRSKLCPRWPEMLLAALAVVSLSFLSWSWVAPVTILLGGIAGVFMFPKTSSNEDLSNNGKLPLRGVIAAAVVMALLLGLPWIFPGNQDVKATGDLLGAGSLVFGGGHVVLPLLETGTVDAGLVDKETFLGGYGAAQAVPGPLFTFGGFLGAAMNLFGNPWLGGAVGLVAVFLPGMVLLAGVLPVWNRLKHFGAVRAGVRGANATVVGVLAAALLGMLRGGAIGSVLDAVLVIVFAVILLRRWIPVWSLVLVAAVSGGVLSTVGW